MERIALGRSFKVSFTIEMSLRGILRGFGLKVGATTRRTYAGRIRELITGHSTLEAIATALLKVREALVHEFAGFERKLRAMTTPCVGVLVALTFVAAVDAPDPGLSETNVRESHGDCRVKVF
ncbi:hypothetical protein [Sinorhizobium medicae]|uniref:hypothetical protein n=1 Tax=Sinorhizobium medicae TaxID=110321 RepID=UPI001F2A5396|nr:hypothetical protein [Sinorhizobium medicae]